MNILAFSFQLLILGPVVAFALLFALIFGLFLFRRGWKIPAPNECLVIVEKNKASKKAMDADPDEDVVEAISSNRTDGLDFRIETSAAWVNPITAQVSRLPLDSLSTDFVVDCHDKEKIACSVKGVILYKVGDNVPAMRAAARRFLDMQADDMNISIRDLVTGQVRALVGGMTIPELINDRQKLIDLTREATHEDMARLGLQIDSLTVQDISDAKNYIDNLGAPQAAAVAREASVAEDAARQAKEEAKQAADLEIARVQRDTQVQAAQYKAEQDQASQKASQAGPLSLAEAQKEVVAQETEVAELQVKMTEKRLDSEVRMQADADRYRIEQEAEADKTRVTLEAEADASSERTRGLAKAEAEEAVGQAAAAVIRARGLAEAEGIEKKAQALAVNGDVVIEQLLAENMPEIARAIAEPLNSIDNMVVLDGADGVTKSVVGVATVISEAMQQIKGAHHRGPNGGSGGSSGGGSGGSSGGSPDGSGLPSSSPGGVASASRSSQRPQSAKKSSSDSSNAAKGAMASVTSIAPIEIRSTAEERLSEIEEASPEIGEIENALSFIGGNADVERVAGWVQESPELKGVAAKLKDDPEVIDLLLSRSQMREQDKDLAKKLIGSLRG